MNDVVDNSVGKNVVSQDALEVETKLAAFQENEKNYLAIFKKKVDSEKLDCYKNNQEFLKECFNIAIKAHCQP